MRMPDWFHPPSNIEKMHSGKALTDEDRWALLQGIAAWIDATRTAGGRGVIACSALKRAFRDVLVGDRSDVRIVYLKGDPDFIGRRFSFRQGHFMPTSLLDSQFATLQEPGEEEHPIVVSTDARPSDIVELIISRLEIDHGSLKRHSGQAANDVAPTPITALVADPWE